MMLASAAVLDTGALLVVCYYLAAIVGGMPAFGWWLFTFFAAFGSTIAVVSPAIRRVAENAISAFLCVLLGVAWVAIAGTLLAIPLSTDDLAIHLHSTTIPSAFVKLCWLAFDVFLLQYWVSELVVFVRTRFGRK